MNWCTWEVGIYIFLSNKLTTLWYTPPYRFPTGGLDVEKKETSAFKKKKKMKRKIIVPDENRADASLLQVQRTAARPYFQRIRN